MSSYWKVFRLIFVVFSLYLVGDAFYRWDAFRYYSTFAEFLPSVALVSVCWSVIAVITAFLVWFPVKALEVLCSYCSRKYQPLLVQFLYLFLLFAVIVFVIKQLMFVDLYTGLGLKIIVLVSICALSMSLTVLFRTKIERITSSIQERINPLLWLFGLLALTSSIYLVFFVSFSEQKRTITQSSNIIHESEKERPNIILVTFDALTARNMSAYGYERETTPFISEWAEKASFFKRAIAESNYTLPVTMSLMTGKKIWTHNSYNMQEPINLDINAGENLPLLMMNSGYYTVAVIQNNFASPKSLGIEESFHYVASIDETMPDPKGLFGIIDLFLYKSFHGNIRLYNWIIKEDFILFKIFLPKLYKRAIPPEMAFNKFLEVIGSNISKPYFAWIHLLAPHDPYMPPSPFLGMFDSSKLLSNETIHIEVHKMRRRFNDKNFTQEMWPMLDIIKARYDEYIRLCDKHFEDFISRLSERDQLTNTVIILSSDHGEAFSREHHDFSHGGPLPNLFEQVTHIPLIIKEPYQSKGRSINDIVEHVDITSTILDLASIAVPLWMEGRSLVPLVRGEKLPARPIFSMNFQQNPGGKRLITKGVIAVFEGDYKLIHYLGSKKSLLFNLKQDPGELTNLFDNGSKLSQHLLSLIQENLKKANDKIVRRE